MTRKLYYEDAYIRTFEARVLELRRVDGKSAVVLDQTAFYPTGGGQPNDRGEINGIPVTDVVKQEDEAILHVFDCEVSPARFGAPVTGKLDWQRRFDHMQHHTGQHILSAAFEEVAGARTVGFHLGVESVTIDLDKPHIKDADCEAAEEIANRVVFHNLPVRAWFPGDEELAEITLRKEPAVEGRLRVVRIEGFDAAACGGTHVCRTGEIGQIKVLKLERRGDKTRVEFRCGRRALHDYRQKNYAVNTLTAMLTVGAWELDAAVERLQEELKAARSAFNRAHGALLHYEGEAMLREAVRRGAVRVVRRVFTGDDGYDAGDLNKLAAQLAAAGDVVVLLGLAGAKAQLVLTRSEDLPHNVASALKRGLAVIDGRGGGRPGYAAGGGVSASPAQVEAALCAAEQALFEA
ncbi:MAG: alanyl-tRNA editing protein [Anaerolineae bacterium]|nr:alanyl-tRNA editing protein [Anaerolineae bacterium]